MPLHVRDLGEGSPVVLLHPGPGLDGSVFLPGVNALVDAGYRALLVDLPGSGRSPGDDFTLRAQAAAVEELMRELDEPTLLGHSFGGYVAMQHLVDFPGSAARVVASCTDADEEEAPGSPEDPFEDLPPDVEAAFERESSVSTPEECHEVWIDQMPFFAVDPDKAVRDARRRRLPASRRIASTTSASCTRSRRWPRPTSRCWPSSARRTGSGRARPSGSPRARRTVSWSSSRARATSRSPRRPSATGRR